MIAGNRHLTPKRQHIGDQAQLRHHLGFDVFGSLMRLGFFKDL
jgi:hypothetical protein